MTRDHGRRRCAAESAARDEPLAATASRIRRWLLVEQPGPWGREALLESRLDHLVAQTVRSHARRENVRVLLVRRPGWDTAAGTRRRVYLVRSDRAVRWIEQLDLDDPRQLTALDLSTLAADEPPGVGVPGPEGVYLVCTNGRHDACCADRGRPVVRALHDAGVAEVWESSHVGGDRFAANVVCLPTGVYYGRVEPDDAARLVGDHGRGVIDLECYRGRSCHPPLVQAAEIYARRHLGERRIDGLPVVAASRPDGDADTLQVTFAPAGGAPLHVEVRRERSTPELLTCTAEGTARPWRYRLVAMASG